MDVPFALVLVRLATFAAAMLPFGTSLFAFYAPLGAAHLPRPVALGAAALLVAALAGWLVLTAASMTDEAGLWAVAGTVREVLLETSFGRVWVAQLGLAVLLLAGLLAGAPAAVVLALAGAALASLAWTGHPAAGRGAQGAVRVGAMAAHLLAGGAWLGGLVPLGLTLRAAGRAVPGAPSGVAREALWRFSRMGYAAVGLLLLSGVTETWLLLGGTAGLSATPYVAVLAAKLSLVALLLGVALANRFGLVPRLEAAGRVDPAPLAALRRNVALEQLLGLLVLAAAGVLGLLPPRLS